MRTLARLFENNRAWAASRAEADPGFFARLARQQAPPFLWIGCADSRVPANEIVGLDPGELFVHRNVANVVVPTDLNALSVLQFAVDVLRVEDVIVCGHYGCGGVKAALEEERHGVVDLWLAHVREVRDEHAHRLASLAEAERLDRLCELNAIEQAARVCRTQVVRDAWERGQRLSVHAWVYGLSDGLLRDLGMTVTSAAELSSVRDAALAAGAGPAAAGDVPP
ncbi:MAG: carbonate dehydratase [Gemmatimonadota bacterium]|nr:carbonate dehydratase [Gemmatimonadota bacterium]